MTTVFRSRKQLVEQLATPMPDAALHGAALAPSGENSRCCRAKRKLLGAHRMAGVAVVEKQAQHRNDPCHSCGTPASASDHYGEREWDANNAIATLPTVWGSAVALIALKIPTRVRVIRSAPARIPINRVRSCPRNNPSGQNSPFQS